jgi:hypothetical protein
MLWTEFVAKAKKSKEKGISFRLSVPTIVTLIYSGAFDSSDPTITPSNRLDKYREMYDQIKNALESEAQLPGKTKTEILGIRDITGDVSLALWRAQTNPLTDFDILGSDKVAEWLKMNHGFERVTDGNFIKWRVLPTRERRELHLVDRWSWVFKKSDAYNMYSAKYPKVDLTLFGIVIDPQIKIYQGSKERLTFKIFTGREYTDELTMWPSEDGKISDANKSVIVNGAVGLCIVKPNMFAGRQSGTVYKFYRSLL